MFPGESAEYRAARDRLLKQEIELRRAMEAVAVARRHVGTIEPRWNLLDFTPRGRPSNWDEQLGYTTDEFRRTDPSET